MLIVPACTHTNVPWFKEYRLPRRYHHEPQKPLVIVIPSYNNRAWFGYNLDSVYQQQYTNFRVIYIDDHSSDGTSSLVQNYVKRHRYTNITLVRNNTRRGALANTWQAINRCKKDEIIVTLDGDDWFAHNQVLSYINHLYQNKNTWLTYGQFQNWPTKSPGWCEKIPARVIATNTFRDYGFYFAQLRTFYAWLAQKIKQKDLIDPTTNDFYQVAGDTALMFPMVELAGSHTRFIKSILYYHNVQTPLNDFKVHHDEQMAVTTRVRALPPYQPLVHERTNTAKLFSKK
jgi:glycosyltransferase involved in cell wall biosynthesis